MSPNEHCTHELTLLLFCLLMSCLGLSTLRSYLPSSAIAFTRSSSSTRVPFESFRVLCGSRISQQSWQRKRLFAQRQKDTFTRSTISLLRNLSRIRHPCFQGIPKLDNLNRDSHQPISSYLPLLSYTKLHRTLS